MAETQDDTTIKSAIDTILRWVGENPDREGLVDTPQRVARAWNHWCGGYKIDPVRELCRTFQEVGGYDEMVVLKQIRFVSHCEHHLAPIIGHAHVGLHTGRPRGRHLEAGTGCGRVRTAPAGAGKIDRRNC